MKELSCWDYHSCPHIAIFEVFVTYINILETAADIGSVIEDS